MKDDGSEMTRLLTCTLAPDVVGLLGRTVAVALAEISRGGCLVESNSAIPEGTVGTLSVTIDGVVYTEDVRVARCLIVPGAGERHQVGVEFLTLTPAGRQSLRLYAASLGDKILMPSAATLNEGTVLRLSLDDLAAPFGSGGVADTKWRADCARFETVPHGHSPLLVKRVARQRDGAQDGTERTDPAGGSLQQLTDVWRD